MDTVSPYGDKETAEYIYATKVKGTDVYDAANKKIGSIDDVALTKRSGEVAYAVLSFGGFLGIGEKYHMLPWHALDYDTAVGGYRVAIAGEDFLDAPSFTRSELAGSSWRQKNDRYYEANPARGGVRVARSSTTMGERTSGDGPGNSMETGPSGTIRLRDGSRDDSLEDDGAAETIDGVETPRQH